MAGGIADCQIMPSVNQIEFHPYSLPSYQAELLPLCEKHGIAISGYASLLPIVRRPGYAVDPVVRDIVDDRKASNERPISVSQVLLSWARQVSGGMVVTSVCSRQVGQP